MAAADTGSPTSVTVKVTSPPPVAREAGAALIASRGSTCVCHVETPPPAPTWANTSSGPAEPSPLTRYVASHPGGVPICMGAPQRLTARLLRAANNLPPLLHTI